MRVMQKRITTSIEENILKKARAIAKLEKKNFNDIIEQSLQEHFDNVKNPQILATLKALEDTNRNTELDKVHFAHVALLIKEGFREGELVFEEGGKKGWWTFSCQTEVGEDGLEHISKLVEEGYKSGQNPCNWEVEYQY